MRIIEVNGCYYLQRSTYNEYAEFYNKHAGSLKYCLKKMHKAMRKYLYNHPEFIEGKTIC